MIRWIAFLTLVTAGGGFALAQTSGAATPKFEAATIKPGCGALAPGRGGLVGERIGFDTSPGRINIWCLSVAAIIRTAYTFDRSDALLNWAGSVAQLVRGGEHWVYSDRYTIEAKAEGTPAEKVMMGTMLEGLLADRLHLTLRHEVEDAPMYALTVAKGGLRIRPMEAGGCTPRVPGMPNPALGPGAKPLCDVGRGKVDGPNWVLDASGMGLSGLVGYLSNHLDRHVIDKTGITDVFSYHLEFARDENAPGPMDPDGPAPPSMPASDAAPGQSVFSALEQQLGLKLEPVRGSPGFIVIEHVERPSEN
jgi:uncharacterized protein (TIGR03435 family)